MQYVARGQGHIPAEIERREDRLKAITEARERIEQRQRDADIERGRSPEDECKPHDDRSEEHTSELQSPC